MTTRTPILRALDISANFSSSNLFSRVNLNVYPGEVVCILGGNGQGKSTLLRTLAGAVPPNKGDVEILGRSPRAAVASGCVGYLGQVGCVLPWLTVRQNIAFGWQARALAPDWARVDEVMIRMQLSVLSERFPSTLSTGERQRVAIARVCAPRPRCLILDEPFAGLDEDGRVRAVDLIRTDCVEGANGCAVLVVHAIAEMASIATRSVFLSVHGLCDVSILEGLLNQYRSIHGDLSEQVWKGMSP